MFRNAMCLRNDPASLIWPQAYHAESKNREALRQFLLAESRVGLPHSAIIAYTCLARTTAIEPSAVRRRAYCTCHQFDHRLSPLFRKYSAALQTIFYGRIKSIACLPNKRQWKSPKSSLPDPAVPDSQSNAGQLAVLLKTMSMHPRPKAKYTTDTRSPLATSQAARHDETPSKTVNPLTPTNNSLLSPPRSGLRRPVSPSGSSTSPGRSRLDLSFLLQTSLYETISTDSALPPFLSESRQPSADASLASLISTFHFRQAAAKAASELCSGSIQPQDHEQILELFWTRLCCLILIDQTKIAAHEARTLSDHLSRNTRSAQQSPSTFVPWPLRLLLHRLQARVAADGRRSIMALYAMGSECRTHAANSSNEEEVTLWQRRLLDIGIRVAAELIEIGEFDTAAQHLQGLEAVADDPEMINRKALLQLRIGNVSAAEETIALSDRDEANEEYMGLKALIQLAQGNYGAAADTYKELHTARPHDTLIANNYAVCLLYTGNMELASSVLEGLIDNQNTSLASGVLFNLATLYELATERAVDRKVRLVERVAARTPSDGGWERTGPEFKL